MALEATASLEEIVALVVGRVAHCYDQHKLCCSESISYVLSQAFASGLPGRDAVQLGAGYCHGMGGAGCSCGALTGAVVILSYYLGPHGQEGLAKKIFQKGIRGIHDQFRERFRATCCRILSRKGKDEKQGRRFSCQELTEGGAEIATRHLLASRPELLARVDLGFLRSREFTL